MNRDMHIYEPELGLDGTLEQLLDWANRYTADYSDEALERLHKLAQIYGGSEADINLPLLLIAERKRENAEEDTMPYERMKIDHLLLGNVSYSETRQDPYMEIEIREERDLVLLSVNGIDENGSWSAANIYSLEEFMNGEADFLQRSFSETLFYGKVYEEDEPET